MTPVVRWLKLVAESLHEKRCDVCTGSRLLQSGPREGRLWCFVHGNSVPPQSFCGSFLRRDSAPAASPEGTEFPHLASCSVSTTATKSHK